MSRGGWGGTANPPATAGKCPKWRGPLADASNNCALCAPERKGKKATYLQTEKKGRKGALG